MGILHVLERLQFHEGHLPVKNFILQFIGGVIALVITQQDQSGQVLEAAKLLTQTAGAELLAAQEYERQVNDWGRQMLGVQNAVPMAAPNNENLPPEPPMLERNVSAGT